MFKDLVFRYIKGFYRFFKFWLVIYIVVNTIKTSSFFVGTDLLILVLLLNVILIGGVLPLYERKFLALTQRRVGPKFVGYKGRLQFIADALKVLLKTIIKPLSTDNTLFYVVPVLYLNISLFFWINVFWLNNLTLFIIEYNFIFLLILELCTHLLLFLTGVLLNNKYTNISANRILNLVFSTELFSVLVFNFFFFFASSFSFLVFKKLNSYLSVLVTGFFILGYITLFFLLITNKTPFDVVEAETEIIMGYHIEYSGFLFGLYVLIEYFHLITASYLIVLLIY